jgi:Peptidase A4 family
MARRWYVPLLAVPVAIGIAVAVLEGVASASPGLTHHTAAGTATVQRLFPGSPMIRVSGGAGPSAGHGALSTCPPTCSSANWAGYAVAGGNGAFRSVSASWTEPKVNCARVHGRRFSSFWVGLDGVTSMSVEQLGTDSDCRGTRPAYYAWWEMFPLPSVNISNPVHAGDHMSASVTFRGAGRFALFIKDSTRHWSHTFIRVHAEARSSAEVIAEAPALLIGGIPVIQNLANFGTVRWTASRMNGTALKNIGGRIHITMVQAVNTPNPLIRATTSPVGSGDAFTNTYRRCC